MIYHIKKLKKPPELFFDPALREELLKIRDRINKLIEAIESLREKEAK